LSQGHEESINLVAKDMPNGSSKVRIQPVNATDFDGSVRQVIGSRSPCAVLSLRANIFNPDS
jgi:hypothetical protein